MVKKRQHSMDGLKACFIAAAGTVLGAGGAGLYTDHIKTEMNAYNARIDKIDAYFKENAESVCINSNDQNPVRKKTFYASLFHKEDPDSTPTRTQTYLRQIIAKMDQTPIGTALNQAAVRHNTIWCAPHGKDSSFYGYYMGYSANVAVINLAKFGGLDTVITEPENFHRTLRTAYEENAHAWQNNELKALRPPPYSCPHHSTAWKVATEASAKAITYAALYQHLRQGEPDIWNDNKNRHSNKTTMRVMREEIEKNGDGQITKDVLWQGFNSFYDIAPLVKTYQTHYSGSQQTKNNRKPIADRYFEEKLGVVPGEKGNYMTGRGFSPELDRYGSKRASANNGAVANACP